MAFLCLEASFTCFRDFTCWEDFACSAKPLGSYNFPFEDFASSFLRIEPFGYPYLAFPFAFIKALVAYSIVIPLLLNLIDHVHMNIYRHICNFPFFQNVYIRLFCSFGHFDHLDFGYSVGSDFKDYCNHLGFIFSLNYFGFGHLVYFNSDLDLIHLFLLLIYFPFVFAD